MCHGYPVVKSGKSALKGAFRITLHDDHRPGFFGHFNFKLLPAAQAEIQQTAALALQRRVRHDIKTSQYLVCHIGMLPSVQPLHVDPADFSQNVVQRR